MQISVFYIFGQEFSLNIDRAAEELGVGYDVKVALDFAKL